MSELGQAKAMFGFIRLPKGWKGLVSNLVSSTIELWTPAHDLNWLYQHIHTQQKESFLSLLHSTSGHEFPSSAI